MITSPISRSRPISAESSGVGKKYPFFAKLYKKRFLTVFCWVSAYFLRKLRDCICILLYAHAQEKNCKNFVFNIFFCSLAEHCLPLCPSSLALSTKSTKKRPVLQVGTYGFINNIYYNIYIYKSSTFAKSTPMDGAQRCKMGMKFCRFCRKGF